MIGLNSLTKIYRTTEIETLALNSIDLTIDSGEFVSIMGPSGCGKSTLLNMIGLLDTPSSGEIHIDGRNITKFNEVESADFRNRTLGFIFQSFHLIKTLNVIDNVELPLIQRRMSSRTRRILAAEMLERVGIGPVRMKHFPSQLSGGQCQRVAIARALVGNPRILLADEPTGNLDSVRGGEIMELLHDLNKKQGYTIVMVTHNEKQAMKTKRIIKLFDGDIV